MSKWHRLRDWLGHVDDERVVLDYDELASILDGPVPASATRHRPVFWSNGRSNSYARYWLDAGYQVQLSGLPADQVAFVKAAAAAVGSGQHQQGAADGATAGDAGTGVGVSNQAMADLVLVGCVKTKGSRPAAAKDLYHSELFRRRRAYAEATAAPWAVLSAEHGLLWPEEVIAPYDRYLEEQPATYRNDWGRRVVARLEDDVGPLDGCTIELHASAAYVEPLRARLESRGATVVWPFAGRRFGEHLAWYDAGDGDEAPPPAASTDAVADRATKPVARGPSPAVRGPSAGTGVARQLTDAFCQETLDLSDRPGAPPPGWDSMPEVVACAALRELGAGEAEARRFCTFIMAMDRARDADLLWQRSVALLHHDPWTIHPPSVVQRPMTELADALRRSGVSQRHGHDAFAWRIIAESLADRDLAPAIFTAIEEGHGHASALLDQLAAETDEGTPRFPLLRGPKIAPVWVRILAYPGGARIDGLDELPVAVDTQVRKVSEYLGVANTAGAPLETIRTPLQQLWHQEVRQNGAAGPPPLADTPAALDPALWFYGKWGCTRCEQAGTRRPISPVCGTCRFDELHRAHAGVGTGHPA